MRQWRVTNRTQGRLELKSIRRVLDAGEFAIVAEPLPDDIKFKMGGGPRRLLDVIEIAQAAPIKPEKMKPVVIQEKQESVEAEPPRQTRRKPE